MSAWINREVARQSWNRRVGIRRLRLQDVEHKLVSLRSPPHKPSSGVLKDLPRLSICPVMFEQRSLTEKLPVGLPLLSTPP